MSVITDTFVLDTSPAERAIDELERALNRALGQVRVDVDTESFRAVDRSLDQIEQSTGVIASDLGTVATRATDAEGDIRGVASAMDRAEDEANRLTTELGESRGAAQQMESATRDVAGQLDRAEDEARRFGTAITRAGREGARANADLVTNLRLVQGIALAIVGSQVIRGIATQLREAAGAAIAVEDATDRAGVTFGESARQLQVFASTASQALGLSEQQAIDAANRVGLLTTELGIAQSVAADFARTAVEVAAGLSLFADLAPEQAVDAVIQGLAGRGLALKQLGVDLSETAVSAKAAQLGIAEAVAAGDVAATVQSRLALIVEGTTQAQLELTSANRSTADSLQFLRANFADVSQEVGETLLPVIEAFIAIAPTIADVIRGTVVPAFDALAGSIAGAVDIPPAAPIIDFFTNLQAAAGGAFDAFAGVGDLFSATAGLLTGDLRAVADESDDFAQRFQNNIERIAVTTLTQDLAAGVGKVNAFGNAVSRLIPLGANLSTFEDSFRRLRLTAGLTDDELRTVTKALLDQRAAIGLSADGVSFLTRQLALLDFAASGSSEAVLESNRIQREAAEAARDAAAAYEAQFTPLGEIADKARDAGVSTREMVNSLNEAAASGDEAARRLLDSAGLLGGFSSTMDEVRTAALEAAEVLRTEVVEGFSEAAQGISGAVDEINVSAKEFTKNLFASELQAAQFEANLALLETRFPKLTEALRAEGVKVAPALEDFLADIDLAARAEDVLSGQDEKIADAITEIILRAASQVEGDEAAITTMQQVAAGMESQTAQNILAQATQSALNDAILGLVSPNADIIGRRLIREFGEGAAAQVGASQGVVVGAARSVVGAFANSAVIGEVTHSRRVILTALLGPDFRFFPFDDLERAAQEAGFATVTGFADRAVLTEAEFARDQVLERFARFPTDDLEALGTTAGLAFAEGYSSAVVLAALDEANKTLADRVTDGVRREFEITSPSKVMFRFGEQLGEGLVLGLSSTMVDLPSLALRSDLGLGGRSQTQSFAPTTTTTGGVSIIVNQPTVTDLETSVSRSAQIAGAISGLLGRVNL
jgi:hypothetical protein